MQRGESEVGKGKEHPPTPPESRLRSLETRNRDLKPVTIGREAMTSASHFLTRRCNQRASPRSPFEAFCEYWPKRQNDTTGSSGYLNRRQPIVHGALR